MEYSCYQKHDSSFEPKTCAKYFERYGLEVEITSDYTDDTLIINIASKNNYSHYYTFRSYKMDRSQYKETLDLFPNYEKAFRTLNAKADLSPKGTFETNVATILMSYLHKKHGAIIVNSYNHQLLGAKEIANLRGNSLTERAQKQKFSFRKFAQKYHLLKILFSLVLIIGYLIFDANVYYGTTVFLLIIVLGLIVLWLN